MDFRTHFDSLSAYKKRDLLETHCDHLAKGGKIERLFALLTNFDFLTETVSRLGIQAAIQNYNFLSEEKIFNHPEYNNNLEMVSALQFIQKALQQSESILEEDYTQLPGQLLARLQPLNNPALTKLLEGEEGKKGAKECDLYPWLEPLTVTLDRPNQPLQRTIVTNHDGDLDAIAISGDGNWALSAKDSQVRVWDLVTGENKHVLEIDKDEICNKISAVAISWNGRWAAVGLYAYVDEKVQSIVHLWDLEDGNLVNRLIAGEEVINGLAISQNFIARVGKDINTGLTISHNCQYIVTSYQKNTNDNYCNSKIWNLNCWCDFRLDIPLNSSSNDLHHVIFNHKIASKAVAITPNGQWAVTASNKFLLLWNISQKQLAYATYIASTETVHTLCISNEGKVTAVFDNGLFKAWNLGSALESHLKTFGCITEDDEDEDEDAYDEDEDKDFGSFEFQVGKLCKHMASNKVTDEKRIALAKAINELLHRTEEPIFLAESLGESKDSLMLAIGKQYPHANDALDSFLQDLRAKVKTEIRVDPYHSAYRCRNSREPIYSSDDDNELEILNTLNKGGYSLSWRFPDNYLGVSFLLDIFHSRTRISRFIFWAARYHTLRKLITRILFTLQESILNFPDAIGYLLAKIFNYDSQDISESRFFDDRRLSLADLEALWESLQIFSFKKPEEESLLHLNGLNLPDSLTSNGLIGLCKTKTGNLHVLDLTLGRSVFRNQKNHRSTYPESRSLHEPWEKTVAVSLDGRYVFSLAEGEALQMWDITGNKPPTLLKREKISSLWQRLKAAYHAIKHNRRGETSLPLHSYLFHKDIIVKNIDIVAKSLSGRWLFLVSKNRFDVRDLAQKNNDLVSRWHLKDVSFNGRWALWQSSARTLRLTNLKTGQIIANLHDCYQNLICTNIWVSQFDKHWQEDNCKYREEAIDNAALNSEGISISTNGSTILFCDSGLLDTWLWEPFQCLTRWDVMTGIVSPAFPAYQQPKLLSQEALSSEGWILNITAFVISSDGQKGIFGLKNGELKFCNLATHQIIDSFAGHRMDVTSVSFSQDDQWAVSCSLDQTLKVWNLPNCKQVASFTINNALYLSKITLTSDGRLLVVSSDKAKHVHVLQLRLPKNYNSASQEQELRSQELDQKTNSSLRKFLPLSQDDWQSNFGIPLPLHRLKDLSDELNSELGINYTNLQKLLIAGKWQQANVETERLMLRVINQKNRSQNITLKNVTKEDIRSFSSTDLLTIDRLWLKYSNGRYGFSLQTRISDKLKDYFYDLPFERAIGQKLFDKLIPCESIQDLRGHFPYSSVFAKENAIFVRMAECSGYLYTLPDEYQPSQLHNKVIEESFSIYDTEKDIFYTNLRNLLVDQEWEQACTETFQRLKSGQSINPQELQIIDELWVEHSQQRYGFSVQKRIWEEVNHDFLSFCIRVGWKVWNSENRNSFQPITFGASAPEGHLPVLESERDERSLLKIFDFLNTHFPATIPYPIQLKAFERPYSEDSRDICRVSLDIRVRGKGILDLRVYNDLDSYYVEPRIECCFSQQWIYRENGFHNPKVSFYIRRSRAIRPGFKGLSLPTYSKVAV